MKTKSDVERKLFFCCSMKTLIIPQNLRIENEREIAVRYTLWWAIQEHVCKSAWTMYLKMRRNLFIPFHSECTLIFCKIILITKGLKQKNAEEHSTPLLPRHLIDELLLCNKQNFKYLSEFVVVFYSRTKSLLVHTYMMTSLISLLYRKFINL